MKKQHIVAMKQQEHVMNERNIMMETRSNFVVRYEQIILCLKLILFFPLDYIRRLKIENIYICYWNVV
jgi:hypothetical protein